MAADKFGEFEITIAQDSGYRAKDIAEFLLHFQGLYIECFSIGSNVSLEKVIEKQADVNKFRAPKYGRLIDHVSALEKAGIGVPNVFLSVKGIELNSPLRVVFYGVIPAIAMAAILSGGKIETLAFKAELPPIGVGIKKLREALQYEKETSSPFGQVDEDDWARAMEEYGGDDENKNIIRLLTET